MTGREIETINTGEGMIIMITEISEEVAITIRETDVIVITEVTDVGKIEDQNNLPCIF